VLGLIIPRGFAPLRGSAELRLSLARPGESSYFVLDYFLSFIELLFSQAVLLFQSGGQGVANYNIWG
jgi:hypothetical protein